MKQIIYLFSIQIIGLLGLMTTYAQSIEVSLSKVIFTDGEVLIKKIQKGPRIILISLNSKYPSFLASEDFRIEGVVRGIYSYGLSND